MKNSVWKRTALAVSIVAGILLTAYPKQTSAAYNYGNTKQKAVCEAMDRMARIQWRPSSKVSIGNCSYSPKVTYRGMPYTQLSNITYDYFIAHCTKSAKDPYYVYSDSQGNDCSTAVALAWMVYFPGINYAGTWTGDYLECTRYGSNAKYHMKTVGGYATNKANTKDYCVSVGYNTVKKYYQQLKPGDALLKYYQKPNSKGEMVTSKHVVLVVGVSASAVQITDQCGRGSGDNTKTTWRRKKTITFQDLYKQYFLPVYCTDVR
ncbi:MAG: hypothetical protein J5379_10905 [Clostridiales bacterium]|nr:hypothetical protein [Clostridiales bacterium]